MHNLCDACGHLLGENHPGILYDITYHHCGETWEDVWCCPCDSECSRCGADVEALDWEEQK